MMNGLLQLTASDASALEGSIEGTQLGGLAIKKLRFADDVDKIANSEGYLGEVRDKIHNAAHQYGVEIRSLEIRAR